MGRLLKMGLFLVLGLAWAAVAYAQPQAVLTPTAAATPGETAKPMKAHHKKTEAVSKPEASPTEIPSVSGSKWVLSMGPGIDVPTQEWNPAYTFGLGGNLGLGVRLDSKLLLGINFDYFHFSGINFAGTVSDNDLRVLPRLQYYFDEEKNKFRAYATLEAGLVFQFTSAGSLGVTDFNFEGALGLGGEYALSSHDAIYLEVRYNCIAASGIVGQDLPVILGYRTNL